ncbi:hypothetical protein EWO26_22025, partial [Salmonella enterica]|nr:hypothetical protein [Salmonella enterica]
EIIFGLFLFVFEIEGVFAVTRHIPVRLFSLYHDKILFNIFKLKKQGINRLSQWPFSNPTRLREPGIRLCAAEQIA